MCSIINLPVSMRTFALTLRNNTGGSAAFNGTTSNYLSITGNEFYCYTGSANIFPSNVYLGNSSTSPNELSTTIVCLWFTVQSNTA